MHFSWLFLICFVTFYFPISNCKYRGFNRLSRNEKRRKLNRNNEPFDAIEAQLSALKTAIKAAASKHEKEAYNILKETANALNDQAKAIRRAYEKQIKPDRDDEWAFTNANPKPLRKMPFLDGAERLRADSSRRSRKLPSWAALRSTDHDYSFDNVDDYVNVDDDTNETELYFSVFDYDAGKGQNVFEISPRDIVELS